MYHRCVYYFDFLNNLWGKYVLLNLVILDKILPKWYHIVWLHVHVTPRTVLVLTFENYFDDL